jgi:diguanylate cyclase (GGDEF)-like protein
VERECSALAEAERTARLGSYTIDLASGELSCSDELRRLLDVGPDQDIGTAPALLACVHPDDRDEVLSAWEVAKGENEPVSVEHRIVRPDGAIRWIDGRAGVVVDDPLAPGRLIGTMQDVSDRRAVESALAHQALHDSLTGLPNRAAFLGRLERVMAQRQLRPSGLAVFFLDIDRFKWLNDSRGHAAGDELLRKVGRRLRTTMRPGDTVARFGGDEFVVLCQDMPTEEEALHLADRLAWVMRRPVDVADEETTITVSIGIAFLAADDLSMTSEALVRDADAAMYEAKEAGRDRHEIFDAETRQAAATRLETVDGLRRAVDRDEFVVHYQPVADLVTRRLTGFEALLRWDRPGHGLQLPESFLGLAEEAGLMVAIGAGVLRTACRQVGAWQAAQPHGRSGPRDLTVSVNIARRQLLDQNLCQLVEEALVESGLLPHQLQLEVAESVLHSDPDASVRALGRLRALGVSTAVDDFGTGSSSLTYLKRFPLDVLKIDGSLVQGLGRDREDRAIVASVVDLAHAFGLTTVAECVETIEQLDELRGIGCELGQGYLWSRPLTAVDADAWLLEHDAPALRALPSSALQPDGEPTIERGRRVLVVDDDRSYRQILRLIIETGTGFRVVGEAQDGREAITLARALAPDVILLDLAMPGMGGLEALPLLLAEVPSAKVVVLSSLEPAYLMEKAGGQGAAAFCTKTDAPDTLLDTLGPWVAA